MTFVMDIMQVKLHTDTKRIAEKTTIADLLAVVDSEQGIMCAVFR